jgi:hypothetical protein
MKGRLWLAALGLSLATALSARAEITRGAMFIRGAEMS